MEHLSLFELNRKIADALALSLEPSYWVVAEIGEIRTHANGHCYLELVDKEGNQIRAKTRATIWSYTYRNLITWFEGITGQHLKPGMKILFNATVQYHEVYGLSLNIRDIDAQYTLGERAKKRVEIIRQLEEDGIFEMNKQLPLPVVPQRIAVISSETAAGFGDFMDQLSKNEFGYRFHIELFNSIMQGDKAEASIISSMHKIFEKVNDFDLLIIIRGGGATLDLDCFDSYDIGSHVAQFPIPVVTGIGHERDETITDMVAHTKMKTPTAVAEFIISGIRNFEFELETRFHLVADRLNELIGEEKTAMDQISYRFHRNVRQLLNRQDMALNKRLEKLQISRHRTFRKVEAKLDDYNRSIKKFPSIFLKKQIEKLRFLEKEIEVLNPENVLQRGYSITTIHGKNINLAGTLPEKAILTTITHRKRIESVLQKQEDRK